MATKLDVESFLRDSSISVAAYYFLATLPAEWRMYRSSGKLKFRWSISRVLFILIRYVSIALLTVSNFGYFYHGFSAKVCSRYYLASPILKVIQIMISQVIVGYRAWNIAQRSKDSGIFLLVFGFIITVLEWYANLDSRIPVQVERNCSPGNLTAYLPQWVFYLLGMLFDVVTIALSSFFLIRSTGGVNRMSSIVKMLLYDGLGYVVALTGVNAMNLILYRNSVDRRVESSGAPFGYMVVWIMSQNILIHIHEAAEVRAQRWYVFGPPGRGASIAQNVGPRKEHDENGGLNLDVQVQIEQAVMVDYNPKTHRKPRVLDLDRKRSEIDGGDSSSTDQGQWELSNVAKTRDVV